MHQNDDDIDLAVTLKDLHVNDTLVDPPIAGVDPIECTSERRQPFAEFVKKQVQSGEFSRDDYVTVNVGALVDSHDDVVTEPDLPIRYGVTEQGLRDQVAFFRKHVATLKESYDKAHRDNVKLANALTSVQKELFEVAIQMKNAAAHARHLVDCIDEFEKDLDKNTPYTAIKDFLHKARTYDGETVYGSISDAIDILAKELLADKEPGSYYDSWIANIAMSVFDQWNAMGCPRDTSELLDVFRGGARRFIDLLTIKQRSITGEK